MNVNSKGHIYLRAAALVLIAALLVLPASALAAGVSATAEPTKADPNDSVTLTVVVSGEKLGAAQGTFTYDPDVLTFVSASGGASDGFISMVSAEKGGSSSLSVVIKFTAKAGGESVIDVDIDEILGYDGSKLESGHAAVSVTVTGSADQPTEQQPVTDVTASCIKANNVQGATEDMYVWRSLEERTLPSRYADRQVEYAGEVIGGAAIPDTEFPILLYLTNSAGENGGYYIFDAARDMLYPYITVSSPSASYTIMRAPDDAVLPEGYTAAVIEDDDDRIDAWTSGEEGVYLIFARDSSGETGFYLYDTVGESIQRYFAPVLPEPAPTADPEPIAEPEPQAGTVTLPIYALIAAGAVIAVLAILVILFAMAKAKAEKRAAKAERRKKLEQSMSENSGV